MPELWIDGFGTFRDRADALVELERRYPPVSFWRELGWRIGMAIWPTLYAVMYFEAKALRRQLRDRG
jgi:hypothetical protein